MFDTNVFTANLALIAKIISTLIVIFVFIKMTFSYTQKRANKCYAQDRKPAPSIPVFNVISKLMFITSMVLTVSSYWFYSSGYLTLYHHPLLQFSASLLVLLGYYKLNKAFKKLGNKLFESYPLLITFTHRLSP